MPTIRPRSEEDWFVAEIIMFLVRVTIIISVGCLTVGFQKGPIDIGFLMAIAVVLFINCKELSSSSHENLVKHSYAMLIGLLATVAALISSVKFTEYSNEHYFAGIFSFFGCIGSCALISHFYYYT